MALGSGILLTCTRQQAAADRAYLQYKCLLSVILILFLENSIDNIGNITCVDNCVGYNRLWQLFLKVDL